MKKISLLFCLFFFAGLSEAKSKYNTVVKIYVNDNFKCSGVVISDSYVATAEHCVDKFIPETYFISDENNTVFVPSRVYQKNEKVDVALLSGDFSDFKVSKTDLKDERLYSTKTFLSCGYPFGSKKMKCNRFTKVGIYKFNIKVKGRIVFPGNSGGPVYDVKTGMLLGVVSAMDSDGCMQFAPIAQFIKSKATL